MRNTAGEDGFANNTLGTRSAARQVASYLQRKKIPARAVRLEIREVLR